MCFSGWCLCRPSNSSSSCNVQTGECKTGPENEMTELHGIICCVTFYSVDTVSLKISEPLYVLPANPAPKCSPASVRFHRLYASVLLPCSLSYKRQEGHHLILNDLKNNVCERGMKIVGDYVDS